MHIKLSYGCKSSKHFLFSISKYDWLQNEIHEESKESSATLKEFRPNASTVLPQSLAIQSQSPMKKNIKEMEHKRISIILLNQRSFCAFNSGGSPYSYCGSMEQSVCCYVPKGARPVGLLPVLNKSKCGRKGKIAVADHKQQRGDGLADLGEYPWHVSIFYIYIYIYIYIFVSEFDLIFSDHYYSIWFDFRGGGGLLDWLAGFRWIFLFYFSQFLLSLIA